MDCFGKQPPIDYVETETEAELEEAKEIIEEIVLETKEEELKELKKIKSKKKKRKEVKNINEKIKEIDKIESLEELSEYNEIIDKETGKRLETVEEVKEYLERQGYNYKDEFAEICTDIEEYKNENKDANVVEVVEIINDEIKEDEVSSNIFTGKKVRAISYDAWTELTAAEKLLVVSDPESALMTQACAQDAYKWTKSKFGHNGLGDKSDGFRHGCWNALMTRDISRLWAKAYATAHEAKSEEELEKKASDGYKEKVHRKMDLHNNAVGRDCIEWYDVWPFCSDKELRERVSDKLTNDKDTGIYWLHKYGYVKK